MLGKKFIRCSLMYAVLATPAVFAQDDPMTGNQPGGPGMHADATQTAMTARASKLIGMNVYNDAGESLGEIHELVLDAGQNRIGYAVLSFGGWMGIRDKLFAIPWNQFTHRGPETNKLYLNVSKDQLKNSPGFDKDKWPDHADRTYWQGVDKHYPAAQSAGGQPAPTPAPADAKLDDGLAWSRKASEVIGADVRNTQDENLGDIKDLVIDTGSGRVRYAVVSFGGWLGIGDKLFAVPMTALQQANNKEKFTMNVTKDQMKNAPGFDDNAWPDFASPQWTATNDAFYGRNGRTESQAARE